MEYIWILGHGCFTSAFGGNGILEIVVVVMVTAVVGQWFYIVVISCLVHHIHSYQQQHPNLLPVVLVIVRF